MKGFTMKTKKEKTEFTPTPICIVGEKEECMQNQYGRQITKSTASRKLMWGFTIVELLTVMAVIAMLLGILVPSLNLVRKLAKDTNQRAQFHGIDIGLETYSSENNGQYPESSVLGTVATNGLTVGAQRLAEALIGRDMLGFDPVTSWDADIDKDDKDVYASVTVKGSSQVQETESLDRRQGPYLNIEKTDAFQVGQLFTDTTIKAGNVYDGVTVSPAAPAPVLTDTYRVKKIVVGGKTVMAGTPILYYKANISSRLFPDTNSVDKISDTNAPGYIYNSMDNEDIIDLGTLKDQNIKQHFDGIDPVYEVDTTTNRDGRWLFYDTITNKQITSQARPFNSDSYILMSAGYDGIYGTRDDIYNFD